MLLDLLDVRWYGQAHFNSAYHGEVMSAFPVNPDNPNPAIGSSSADERRKSTVKLGPFEYQGILPPWAVASIAVLIVLGVASFGGVYVRQKILQIEADADNRVLQVKNSVLVPMSEMRTYEANADHSKDHIKDKEDVEQPLHEDGSVVIHHYYNDGCVQIIRLKPGGEAAESKWFFGSRHKFKAPPKAKSRQESTAVDTSEEAGTPSQSKKNLNLSDALLMNTLYESMPNPKLLRTGAGSGKATDDESMGCWDPHPGNFQFVNVPLNQCLVRVDRVFYDGCAHSQLYNPCNGAWDILPNGQPRVSWTRCLH